MNDSLLLKISLSCSLAGLVLLFIFSLTMAVPEKKISEISESDAGSVVIIKGTLASISHDEKRTLLSISQEIIINAILFDDPSEAFDGCKGDQIEVKGEIASYKGSQSLIVESIKERNASKC